MGAAGVMLIGQVAMSFVGPLDQYAAANLGPTPTRRWATPAGCCP